MVRNDATAPGGETARISEFVWTTTYNDISKEAIDHAKQMILDTVGVSLAGFDADIVRAVRERYDGAYTGGPSRAPGTDIRGSEPDVALLFGSMAHALDFDDVHRDMGGHPSAPVLAALLPVAEAIDASGTDLLRSFILGCEVEITLARILNPGHYERGWHPTSVVGHVGAAVAVGDLLRLDELQLRHIIGVAGSQACGLKGNFGSMTKPYHVGNAARDGVEAAHLVSAGMTANTTILEKEFDGFCDLFQGDPRHEFGEHVDRMGSPWDVIDPPVRFKPYPCCGSTHSAVDAARELRARDNVEPEAVESIEIHAHPRRLGHTDNPSPTSGIEAKFSVQYCTAVMLERGDVWLDDFSDAVVARRNLPVPTEEIVVRRRQTDFEDREWGARVSVSTKDNREHVAEVDAPSGSVENPLSEKDVREKYRRCASTALPEHSIEQSLSTIVELEELESVSELVDDLTLGTSQ